MPEAQWTVPRTDGPALVVLEGVAVRLGLPALEALLQRIRSDAPRAIVVLDLPGILPSGGPSGRSAVAVGVVT